MHEINLSEAVSRWFYGNKHTLLLMARNSGNNILVRRFRWYVRVWKFILKLHEKTQLELDKTERKIVDEAKMMIPKDTGCLRGTYRHGKSS